MFYIRCKNPFIWKYMHKSLCMYDKQRREKEGMQVTSYVILLILLDFIASLIVYFLFLFFIDFFISIPVPYQYVTFVTDVSKWIFKNCLYCIVNCPVTVEKRNQNYIFQVMPNTWQTSSEECKAYASKECNKYRPDHKHCYNKTIEEEDLKRQN